MTPNLLLLIAIIVAVIFLIIGVYIGFVLSDREDKRSRKEVDSMDVTELFKRYHGISD